MRNQRSQCEHCVSDWWLRRHHGVGEHASFLWIGIFWAAVLAGVTWKYDYSGWFAGVLVVGMVAGIIILVWPVLRNYLIGARVHIFRDTDGKEHEHGWFGRRHVVSADVAADNFFFDVVLGGIPGLRKNRVVSRGQVINVRIRMEGPDRIRLWDFLEDDMRVPVESALDIVRMGCNVRSLLSSVANLGEIQKENREEIKRLRAMHEATRRLLLLLAFMRERLVTLHIPPANATPYASPFARALVAEIDNLAAEAQLGLEPGEDDGLVWHWLGTRTTMQSVLRRNPWRVDRRQHLMSRTREGWQCFICDGAGEHVIPDTPLWVLPEDEPTDDPTEY